MDIIRIPFGYLLDWLCQLSGGSYGLALILFSLLIKVVLFPMSAKSKKSMLKMSRLAPQLKALEIECGDNKEKYSQEMSKLYKQEGVSPFGGCLWSFVPLLILLPLYHVIREPITYMLHFSKENAATIVATLKEMGAAVSGKNNFYEQLEVIGFLSANKEAVAAALPELAEQILAIRHIDFTFFGLNLSITPEWKFWAFTSAAQWGMLVLPVLSAASQWLSMVISQKMNNKVATNSNGEQDKAAADAANQSGKSMMLLMPVMSLYFCFIMPAAISIYWVAQAVFGTLQDVILTKHYRKVYEIEDAQRREVAAAAAAKQAERERIRAERREKYGEEGIVDPNTSKKKLKQQEQEAKAAKAEAYEASKKPAVEAEEAEDKHFSGDPERPYCRGRGYKPNRYGRKDDAAE